eukprot:5313506-Pleurochrysis_carterae.AAC.1
MLSCAVCKQQFCAERGHSIHHSIVPSCRKGMQLRLKRAQQFHAVNVSASDNNVAQLHSREKEFAGSMK